MFIRFVLLVNCAFFCFVETILEHITSLRSSILETLKAYPVFHSNRGKRLSKCLKYPGLEDYNRGMQITDRIHVLHLSRIFSETGQTLSWIIWWIYDL